MEKEVAAEAVATAEKEKETVKTKKVVERDECRRSEWGA